MHRALTKQVRRSRVTVFHSNKPHSSPSIAITTPPTTGYAQRRASASTKGKRSAATNWGDPFRADPVTWPLAMVRSIARDCERARFGDLPLAK